MRRLFILSAIAAILLIVKLAIAGFAIFQIGTNSSSGCPDATPAVAGAFNLNTCTFFDPMTSLATIDVNATNAAPSTGINWYTQQSLGVASFTAVISGTGLTASSSNTASSIIKVGQTIGQGNGGCGPVAGTTITALGTGTGGDGTYTVTPSQTLASCQVQSSFAQAPNTMTVGANGLTLLNVSQGDANFGLSTYTALQIPTGSLNTVVTPYRGISFTNGMYARAYITFDETKAPNGMAGPPWRWNAWWMDSFPGTKYGGQFIETDNCDCFSNNGSVLLNNFLHDINCGLVSSCSGNSLTDMWFGQPPSRSAECNPVLDGVTFHTFDQLWVPPSKNNGTGIYAYLVDADTCAGNAVFTGFIDSSDGVGTNRTLHVTSMISTGTIAVNSYIGNSGPLNLARRVLAFGTNGTTGAGTTGTYALEFDSSSSVSSSLMIATNGNSCEYFAQGSGNKSQCSYDGVNANTTYDGAFTAADPGNASGSKGFTLIFNGGCTASYTTSACNAGTSAGNWPFHIKNVQVWQGSTSDKNVQN
jgi:hypothetical protein